jgi:amidase
MNLNRREVLQLASFVPALAARPAIPFDPDFGTAASAAAAVRTKKLSAEELTRHALKRIAKYNPQLNAIIVLLEQEAIEQARAADRALARGKVLGPLHGVPITIKEAFRLVGTATTWGRKELVQAKSTVNALAVQRMIDSGAVILGKTNVPVDLSDWQSNNPIWGVSNNPWDTKLTPGGSTGGGAAAAAAGLGFLALGSDIAGSIRVPAHFCGIYGHKPTLNIVPLHGHLPGGGGNATVFPMDLAVAGPLARSAADLRLMLQVCAGPEPEDAVAVKWTPPPARGLRPRDFRVGYIFDDRECMPSSEIGAVMEGLLSALSKAGAKLERGWPEGINPARQFYSYGFLVGALTNAELPESQVERLRSRPGAEKDPFTAAAFQPHRVWLRATMERLAARKAWHQYFRSHDVFLTPTAFVPAFPHIPPAQSQSAKLATPEGERAYLDLIYYVGPFSFSGIPATSAPVGKTRKGLPVGVQVAGPWLEDWTPIAFAEALSGLVGGFESPPGYGPV